MVFLCYTDVRLKNPESGGDFLRVLIVDDDRTVLEDNGNILKKWGMKLSVRILPGPRRKS